ncbi:hypothetical protein JCM10212_005593 [Sporobolomyces blumeae]
MRAASTALACTALAGLVQLAAAAGVNYWPVQILQGPNLTQAFNWETGGGWDNGGIPLYVSQIEARRNYMFQVKTDGDQSTVYKVDTTAHQSPYRKSTRLSSKQNFYSGGLFVFDVAHIPVGLWPALWMVGLPDWPNAGEIDIIEGVHMTTKNTQSFHTGPNCTMQSTGFTNTFTLDSDLKYNCTLATEVLFCPVSGAPFNLRGGGVFVVQWNTTGIAMYQFPRSSIPQDISSGNPNGLGWGTPTAYLANTQCDIMQNFHAMKIVINTNLCGVWAGNVWDQDLWYAGSSGTAAAKTRVATCDQYVQTGGFYALKEAYWTINSIKIYNSTDPGLATPAPPNGTWVPVN